MADDETAIAEVARDEKTANRIGCFLQVVLWIAILMLLFWPDSWGPKPTWAKWIVIGYGVLILLGLLHGMIFGELGERIFSFIILTVLGIIMVLIRL